MSPGRLPLDVFGDAQLGGDPRANPEHSEGTTKSAPGGKPITMDAGK